MKLYLKKGDKEISLDVMESRIKENICDFIINVCKEFFADSSSDKTNVLKGDSETFAEHYDCLPVKLPAKKDSFTIRERLPNNVINLADLNVKQAVTEAALVRCPVCGQSHAIILMDGDKLYLMRRSYSAGEFGIVYAVSLEDKETIASLRPNGDTPEDRLNYFLNLQGMDFLEDKDFNVSNDTEVFCPVCGKSSSFFSWKEAYENKENYFEHQYVCGACGGECVMDAAEEKESSEIVVCTKCGRKWLKGQV